MNANTLADELDDIDAYEKHQTLLGKASEMLRQQQAEIEALKAEASPYKSITNTKSEPTVVIYTHPVKELTDEEIKFIAYPFESVYTTYDKQTDTDTVHTRFDQLGFARAILRKAQEK